MKTWKIRGLALAACLAFVTTACESKNDDVADRRPTATVAVTGADGRGDADNGGVSYGAEDAASETAYKSEARESNRRDASDNEGSDRKSDKKDKSHKKGESGQKDKSDKKHESEKEGKPEQKDKSDKKGDSEREGESGQKDKLHKKGESDKREGGKAGSGASKISTSGNYYFDDDDDEIVTPDGTLVGEDDPVTVVKAHNGVARIFSSGGTVRVEGDVEEIAVYGSDVDVVADSAAKVRILGSDVDVFVRSVSSVRFDGSDNDVRWTDGPMPSVTDNGAENEIRRARPAPAR